MVSALNPEAGGNGEGVCYSVSLRTLNPEPLVEMVKECDRHRPFRTWRLLVVFPNGKEIVVMWNRNDSVLHVKDRLENKIGIPRTQQVLQLAGVASPLLDGCKLVEYNMKDEAVIRLSFATAEAHFQIFVNGNFGKTMTIWVKPSDLIDDVKGKIAEKQLIPAKDMRLICNGREMHGGRSLSDYHVRKNNTLFLVLRLHGGGSMEEHLRR